MRTDVKFDNEAEHLAHCEECTRFVEQQQELGTGLRLARLSVPRVPASLDSAVVANYRRQIADRRASARTAPQRRFAILCWSAAAAAIVLIAALLPFTGRKTIATAVPTTTVRPTNVPPGPAPAATVPQLASAPPAGKPHGQLRKRSRPQQPQQSEPSNVVLTGSLPPDFRSLMYCDELSCSGPMEVIRMQLPASGALYVPGSNSADGTILADVLVGPDGIARGIRIVE